MPRFIPLCLLSLVAALGIAGCGGSPQGFAPIDSGHAVFWDRQTEESAALLREIASEFNAAHEGLPLEVERAGGYGDIFRKTTASIHARKLPAMAVAYESMISEYIPTGAVVRLDDLLEDPERGFTQEERQDFFPVALDTNRYSDHGGDMYSFPFSKSVLVMYYNKALLEKAGIEAPPATWDAFVEQCRAVKAASGKHGYALSVDCSTFNGMVFSMGGEVYDGRETRFDSAEAVRVFELLDLLIREELAYQITPGTFDDNVALVNGEVAFTLRTSASIAPLDEATNGDRSRWGVAPIPQADPSRPGTVLFGPNVVLFNTTPEQIDAAWEFTKHFTSTENSVRWSLATGYLPIRKSAARHPGMQARWNEWPDTKIPFDCLEFAHAEPNAAGWQEVRRIVEEAKTKVITGISPPAEAAAEAKRLADAALQRHADAMS